MIAGLNNPILQNQLEITQHNITVIPSNSPTGSSGSYPTPAPIPTQGDNPQDLIDFLNSETFRIQILKIIRSLSKVEASSIENDPNPLDNIIRAEITEYLNFRRISKTKIKEAKHQITLGQNPYNLFTLEEAEIILKQALFLELITQVEYNELEPNPNTLYNTKPTIYSEILDFQESLPNNIPTIEELKLAGIVNFIIQTVKENPEAVIDEELIQNYTEEYIHNVLLTSEFIGYTPATKIYANPQQTLLIINKVTFKNWARRVGLYLKFVTEEKIQKIDSLIPSQYLTITEYFSPEQIRLMIDKEIDIKNLILQALTFKELQTEFNKLAEYFKDNFMDLFTNEKLMELVYIGLSQIIRDFHKDNLYDRLEIITKKELSQKKREAIDFYLETL